MLRTLLFAALLSLLALPAAAADLIPAAERAPAADFSLDNLDDDGVSLSEQAGKVVVISFWATWCQPCLQELPHMNDFQREFSDDLVVFAITTDGPETQSEVRSRPPKPLDLPGAQRPRRQRLCAAEPARDQPLHALHRPKRPRGRCP